jgi:hypothetical protein
VHNNTSPIPATQDIKGFTTKGGDFKDFILNNLAL